MAEAQLVASVVLLEELVPPRCESDDELEYIAKLLLKTERTLPLLLQAILRIRPLFIRQQV